MSDLVFRPQHFINRELSWLDFNARVLEEAQDPTTPLLERVKFLSIFSSNMDEFFMVRVAGLREQAFEDGAPQDFNADGMRAPEQLEAIRRRVIELVKAQYQCWSDAVCPQLREEGVLLATYDEVRKNKSLDRLFQQKIFPVLTPMAVDPSHPRPRYHNRGLYLAALLRRRSGQGPRNLFAVVQLPQVLSRLVPVPGSSVGDGALRFIFLEDLVAVRLPELFGGFEVESFASFRITRDSDLDIIAQESDDMLRLIEERLKARRRGDAVRLEVSANASPEIVETLVAQEEMRTDEQFSEVYSIPGPIDLTGLDALVALSGFEHLREPPVVPQVPRALRRRGVDIFTAIAQRDVFLHHPYDSFAPVVEFVERASTDPKVLAIKQTLYRTSGDSPIVQSLMAAAEDGKHVTAVVELQARFDEAANVSWSRQLERSGVHVVYGFMDLKTHLKVSLVVRQEEERVRRYAHLGTGNYNPTTARFYTDVGLFTADEEMITDVSAVFNLLTGYSQGHEWRKLVVAPQDLQAKVIELIQRQTNRAEKGRPSRIFAKMNSLVDPRVIEALYRASVAGVPIDLCIRGICCLRPGVEGLSENIRVRSIVDRFLEHSRFFVFGPDDNSQIFISSADWMPRNFYRRVEVMVPIESPQAKKQILREIVPTYLNDNVKSRELRADGTYVRVAREEGEAPFRSQSRFYRIQTEKSVNKDPFSFGDDSSAHLDGADSADEVMT